MTGADTICRTCLRLKKGLCDGEKDQTACPSYEPMTNGDKIRAMTDEELAELLKPLCMNAVEMCKEEITYECLHYNDNVKCAECWLDWLKQEVSE